MSSPEEHHELGPSTLKYVEICPGYRSSNETNQFAEEGTMLHSAAETLCFRLFGHKIYQLCQFLAK